MQIKCFMSQYVATCHYCTLCECENDVCRAMRQRVACTITRTKPRVGLGALCGVCSRPRPGPIHRLIRRRPRQGADTPREGGHPPHLGVMSPVLFQGRLGTDRGFNTCIDQVRLHPENLALIRCACGQGGWAEPCNEQQRAASISRLLHRLHVTALQAAPPAPRDSCACLLLPHVSRCSMVPSALRLPVHVRYAVWRLPPRPQPTLGGHTHAIGAAGGECCFRRVFSRPSRHQRRCPHQTLRALASANSARQGTSTSMSALARFVHRSTRL